MKIGNFFLFLVLTLNVLPLRSQESVENGSLAGRFRQLGGRSEWRLVSSIPLKFNAFHTQGLVKLGEDFYMTAVEVKRWPKQYGEKKGRYDRDTGEGTGHLLKFSGQGELLADIKLGKGPIYHPGGIDFDGRHIWAPVCEYRPFGLSVVYKVDTATLKPVEVFEFDDALGALAFDRESRTLVGANWGSRGLYKWAVDENGVVRNPQSEVTPNPSFYVDYQDCHYVGEGLMLCSGLKSFASDHFSKPFRLGGLDLIRVEDLRPVHQVPVTLWTPGGSVMTNNPMWLEATEKGLRAYFIPDDDLNAVLYVYEIMPE